MKPSAFITKPYGIADLVIRQTLTNNQGKEMALHERLTKRVCVTVYFYGLHSFANSSQRERQRPTAAVLLKGTDQCVNG